MVAIAVASHRDAKNYPNLLRAVRHARGRGSSVRLVAVGDGPLQSRHRVLADELGVSIGTILRIQVDTSNPLGYGMSADTYGFYNNSPFFTLVDGFNSARASVIARYPNEDVVASGWLRGEDAMAGRAAVVEVNLRPGRIVLFGLRPQHRGQTHATFPMLFNSLYLSAEGAQPTLDEQQQQQ